MSVFPGASRLALLLLLALTASSCQLAEKLQHQRNRAQSIAAVSQMRSVQTAQVAYYSQAGRFAANLTELGPGRGDLISTEMASGTSGAFLFDLKATVEGYHITARPKDGGAPSFFTDQTGILRFSDDPANPAGPRSPEWK